MIWRLYHQFRQRSIILQSLRNRTPSFAGTPFETPSVSPRTSLARELLEDAAHMQTQRAVFLLESSTNTAEASTTKSQSTPQKRLLYHASMPGNEATPALNPCLRTHSAASLAQSNLRTIASRAPLPTHMFAHLPAIGRQSIPGAVCVTTDPISTTRSNRRISLMRWVLYGWKRLSIGLVAT